MFFPVFCDVVTYMTSLPARRDVIGSSRIMASLWVQAFPPELHVERNAVFRANPGVRNMPLANAHPAVYFGLLFTTELMKEIVRRTNR